MWRIFLAAGMLWQECKQLYGSSLREYLSSLFNIMDSFSLVLYLASFALRYVSSYKVREKSAITLIHIVFKGTHDYSPLTSTETGGFLWSSMTLILTQLPLETMRNASNIM